MFLRESMESGRSVHVKGFGTFAFEPTVLKRSKTTPASTVLSLRPCFIASRELEQNVRRGKKELVHQVNGSVYQQAVRMTYLNPVPIAHGCYLKVDFVKSGIEVIFRAISDLVMRNYNLNLVIDHLVTIRVIDRKLSWSFAGGISNKSQAIAASWPLKSVNSALGPHGTQKGFLNNLSPVQSIIRSQSLSSRSELTHLQNPDRSKLKDMKTKITNLCESSRDLFTIAQ